jgi:DNA processing protein
MLCENEVKVCERLGVHIIHYNDNRYPPLLRMISDPPAVLFVRGDQSLLTARPCVAVVGARKATAWGLTKAYEIARGLAKQGIAVVSGMAYGIDSAAHQGALDGGGTTIAVWGTGPDIIYPRTKRELAQRIVESGAALTEFHPGEKPAPYHFPQRNRIISGLSLAVVVVEAAAKSGSLITVDFALDQGREVCAIPGGAGLVAHEGSNRLIKEGAFLVESAQDIVDALFAPDRSTGFLKKTGQPKKTSVRESRLIPEMPSDDPIIVCMRGGEAVSLDDLIASSGLAAGEVMERVTALHLDGVLEELPGKRYRIKG